MRYRLLLLGGLAGLAALPSAAHAAPTCAYDTGTREVNLRYGPIDNNVTLASGPTLRYAEAGAVLRTCTSPTGVAATPANTAKITIRGASGTGAVAQTTTLDETAGNLMAANRNLKAYVFTGTNDRLVIREGAGLDRISLRDQTGLGLGPALDLDYDGIVDLMMTTDDSIVEVDGGVGDDVIDGWTVNTYQML